MLDFLRTATVGDFLTLISMLLSITALGGASIANARSRKIAAEIELQQAMASSRAAFKQFVNEIAVPISWRPKSFNAGLFGRRKLKRAISEAIRRIQRNRNFVEQITECAKCEETWSSLVTCINDYIRLSRGRSNIAGNLKIQKDNIIRLVKELYSLLYTDLTDDQIKRLESAFEKGEQAIAFFRGNGRVVARKEPDDQKA